jgi:hypothetical protein
MTIKKDYDDLERLEQAYMSCWGITDDIKKISLYSENIEKDILSLRDVYNIKFKELSNCVDEVDKNLYNLREAWEEMRPGKNKEELEEIEDRPFASPTIDIDEVGFGCGQIEPYNSEYDDELDKDLFGNVVLGEDGC